MQRLSDSRTATRGVEIPKLMWLGLFQEYPTKRWALHRQVWMGDDLSLESENIVNGTICRTNGSSSSAGGATCHNSATAEFHVTQPRLDVILNDKRRTFSTWRTTVSSLGPFRASICAASSSPFALSLSLLSHKTLISPLLSQEPFRRFSLL